MNYETQKTIEAANKCTGTRWNGFETVPCGLDAIAEMPLCAVHARIEYERRGDISPTLIEALRTIARQQGPGSWQYTESVEALRKAGEAE